MIIAKDFIITTTISAALCGISEILIPRLRMGRIMKFVFACFMVYAIIIPLPSIYKELTLPIYKDSFSLDNSFEKKILKQQEKLYKRSIKHLFKDELSKFSVYPKKIKVIMDTHKDSGISILQIEIYLDKDYPHLDLKKILEEKFSMDTKIIVQKELFENDME